jgi:hypothetical protein
MGKSKTSISKVSSYKEIGEFWDEHDLTDFWNQTKPAKFDVDIRSEQSYFLLEQDIAEDIYKIAHDKGICIETLINSWIKEKIIEQKKLQKI